MRQKGFCRCDQVKDFVVVQALSCVLLFCDLMDRVKIASDMKMTRPYRRKRRRTKEPLDETERGE